MLAIFGNMYPTLIQTPPECPVVDRNFENIQKMQKQHLNFPGINYWGAKIPRNVKNEKLTKIIFEGFQS